MAKQKKTTTTKKKKSTVKILYFYFLSVSLKSITADISTRSANRNAVLAVCSAGRHATVIINETREPPGTFCRLPPSRHAHACDARPICMRNVNRRLLIRHTGISNWVSIKARARPSLRAQPHYLFRYLFRSFVLQMLQGVCALLKMELGLRQKDGRR